MVSVFVKNIIVGTCLIVCLTAVEAKPSTAIISQLESYDAQVERYEAFLSYRRTNSQNLAMLLKVLLERDNVTAFIDLENPENFMENEQQIKDVELIKQIPNFILVLANGSLDKCKGDVNYTDFMHQEIREAVVNKRRIILVFDDFDFPDAAQFSPEIQVALDYQGLTWEHKLVDQSVERLLSYMAGIGPLSSYHHNVKLPLKGKFANEN